MDYNTLEQGYQQYKASQLPKVGQGGVAAQAQPEENWFQKLLPTIGSIAAPVIGGLLAPETGGLSLLASSALSGLGAGAGKALENVTSGQDAFKDVGQEALMSGGGSLVLGGIGKGLGSFLSSKGVPAAETGAAKMFAGQAPAGAIGSDTARQMVKYGLTSPNEAAGLGKILSGSSQAAEGQSILTKGLENAVTDFNSAQPDKLTKFADFFTSYGNTKADKVGRLINDGNSFVGNRLQANNLSELSKADGIRQQVASIFKNYGADASIGGKIEPLQALQAQREFAGLASQYGQAAARSGDYTASNISRFYSDLSNELKNRLGINVNNLANAIPISVAEKKALAEQISKTGIKGADQFAQQLLSNPEINTWAHVRQLEAPFIETSQAAQKAFQAAEKKFGTTGTDLLGAVTGFGVGGPVGAAAGYGLSKVAESPAGAKAATGILAKIAGVSPNVASTLGRIGAVGGGAAGTIPGWAGQGNLSPVGGANKMQGQGQGGLGQDSGQPITDVYNLLKGQLLAGGPLLSNYGSLQSTLAGLAPKAQVSGELDRLTGGLGAAYLGAGGPQGLLGGLGALATGFIPGTPANLYNRQQQGVASLLQSLYGIQPGVGVGLTPQFTQSPTTAGIAAGNLGL